jgi:peptidoglycan/LPS O-acetylase OafA/YrhL
LFYWISRLSFGMYLNHEYIAPWVVERLLPALGLGRSHLVANLAGVAVLVVISAAVALVTFCLVEHPFLQLRKIVLAKPARGQASDFTPVTR